MGDRQRFAVIGCGGMESSHERAFRELRDRVEVVATVDVDRERAEEAAKVLNARHAVTDFRDALDEVDAVMLVLPHHLHHPIGLECLQAGKHVLMEKPMAMNEAQCLDLIHTARQADRVLMTAYVMRFHPLVVKLKEMIDAKELGDVFQMSIWTEQLTHYPDGHWANSADTVGGGQFFSHGCHYMDLLLWFLGSPVRGTHLGTRRGTEWLEKEGTSNVAVEFSDGALGYHFGTWGARGTRLRYTIHAHGTEGMAEIELRTGLLRLYKGDTVRTVMSDPNTKNVVAQLGHFLDCVQTGQPPLTDGPTSLQGLRAIWRLYAAEQHDVVANLRGLGFEDPWDVEGLDRLPAAEVN